MRKIKLFIACSLDGYIARSNGDIDWLFTEGDYGYHDFYASIDTIIMGYKTYEKGRSLGEFQFKNKKNFVFTRFSGRKNTESVTFASGDIIAFTKKLKKKKGKDIWLMGGGEIIKALFNEKLIDEYIMAIHPVVLTEGIPLFSGLEEQQDLVLTDVKKFPNGLVEIFYKKSS